MPSKMKKDDDTIDEDLKDLLSSSKQQAMTTSNGHHQRTTSTQRRVPGLYAGPKMSLVDFCSAYISMMCYYNPICCGCFSFLVLIGFLVLLSTFLVNPTQTYGEHALMGPGHDHSNIKSIYDLKMGDIDHWCLGGGNGNCPCEDPLQPIGRLRHKSWIQAYKANQQIVTQSIQSSKTTRIDVVFLGESVIEEMTGRWMGRNGRSPLLTNLESVFRSNFQRSYGAKIEGVALGIAGDSAPNVLWRLLHGELSPGFDPSVWWISLGNNDLGRMQCSEEVVVIGILRVVEEIMSKRPWGRIVINSVFPMMELRGGEYPVISDYKDSFVGQHAVPAPNRRNLDERSNESSSSAVAVDPAEAELSRVAEEEERKRDSAARVERLFARQFETNPVLKESDFARKNRLGTFRAAKKPLWSSIKAINRQLKKFADNNEGQVYFYDASPLFVVVDEATGRSKLQTGLISPRGHPTPSGFAKWERGVIEFLEPILEEMQINYINEPDSSYDRDDDGIKGHMLDETDDFTAGSLADGSRFDDMFGPIAPDVPDPTPPAMVMQHDSPPQFHVDTPMYRGRADDSEKTAVEGIDTTDQSPPSQELSGTNDGSFSNETPTTSGMSHVDVSAIYDASATTNSTDTTTQSAEDLASGSEGDHPNTTATAMGSEPLDDNSSAPPDGDSTSGINVPTDASSTTVDNSSDNEANNNDAVDDSEETSGETRRSGEEEVVDDADAKSGGRKNRR